MGWLVRYTGKAGKVDVPGKGPTRAKKGDTFDVAPTFARRLVADPEAPWERIKPGDAEYVPAEDRA